MAQLITFLIAGAVSGALYAILAAGLTLTYATSGIFNLAHGAIAYVIALLYYELNTGLHWPVIPAAIFSILVVGPLLGVGLDVLMFRRLTQAGSTAQLVATTGLAIALPAAAYLIVQVIRNDLHADIASPDNVSSPPGLGPASPTVWHLTPSITIDSNQLATLAAGLACAALLWVIVKHTRLGLRMRAVVDRRELAVTRGVNSSATSSTAWALSGALAGLTGVLAAPYLSLGSDAFTTLMLVSAAATVFARLRSIPGALIAGLGLGVAQDLISGYVEPSVSIQGLASSALYIFLFVGLLILLYDRSRRGGTVADESPPRGMVAGAPSIFRGAAWAVVVALLVAYVMLIAPALWVGLIQTGLALGIVFLSFTVVTGIGGMVSLAQPMFVTSAGVAAGYLLMHNVPFPVAFMAAVALATAVGLVVALPALRLGGVALALATFALASICDQMIFQLPAVSNQDLGWLVPRPTLGTLSFSGNRAMTMLVLVVALALAWVVRNIQRSASGRAMLAARSSAVGAAASGISLPRVRLLLFGTSAALAGLGGVLYASSISQISTSDFTPDVGLIWLAVMVSFGVSRPAFALVAGVVYSVFPQLVSYVTASTVIPQILFGLGGVVLARHPEGFMANAGAGIGSLARRVAARIRPVADVTLTVPESLELAVPGPRQVSSLVAADRAEPAAGPPAEPPALALRGIHAGYGGSRVLHGVDLHVPAGRIVAVVGANGAGKSTLCAVASGLLSPAAGTVTLHGADVTGMPAHRRARRGLAYAPEARGVFPGLSVEDNFKLTLATVADREAGYARFPALAHRRRLAAGSLSGGEQQVLALAPFFQKRPGVLLADEPTLGLAPRIVSQVHGLLTELRDAGVAILLVEERVSGVVAIADELVVLTLGHVTWRGAAADADTDRITAAYLGADVE